MTRNADRRPIALLTLLTVLVSFGPASLAAPPALGDRSVRDLLGPDASDEPDRAPAFEATIAPVRRFIALGRPLLVEVRVNRTVTLLTAVAMDHAGNVLDGPVRVREGRADLLELLPSLESIGRAAYVQLVYYEQPVGPALVVEPLLSPMWPRTEVRIERGARRTVITGWEVQPPGPDGHPPLEEEAPDADERPTADTGGETTAREAADAGIRRLLDRRGRRCSGFRSYVEQDVRLETTEGTLRVALRPDEAPATAWNFRRLAAGGLYDGLPFHRVVPVDREGRPFVIQGGDPAGDGEGGPGERIAMEPSALEHDFGVVSMARDDHPDSAGSQFFIALSRAGTARLDGQYCAFGAVVAGAPVIRAIAATELADPATGRPADPPMVVSAELVPAPPRIPTVGRPDRLVRPDDELEPAPVTPKRVPR